MSSVAQLSEFIQEKLRSDIVSGTVSCGELTLEVTPQKLKTVCQALRDEPQLQFDMLVDVCGVDYLHHGKAEWTTDRATSTGFERGVDRDAMQTVHPWEKPRFAVVYHLLSVTLNHRIRVKVFLDNEPPMVDSVVEIWASANWFEREAFDLFGILFNGHPDLRRLLTDYGFIGHPFRKDFPLSGHVEVRYDATQKRVVYEPVDIEPRVLVPKTIRDDSRYCVTETEESKPDA